VLDGHGVSRLGEDASTRAASTLDGMTESGVTVHREMTTALDDKTAMLWQRLGAELTGLVDDPSSVTLVVTDQMPAVISKLEAKVPWQFGGQDAAATYTPDKPDGARASAKTLQLADETVVVIDSAVVHFGKATTRRIVHHEGPTRLAAPGRRHGMGDATTSRLHTTGRQHLRVRIPRPVHGGRVPLRSRPHPRGVPGGQAHDRQPKRLD
jgi:hypothetical protein